MLGPLHSHGLSSAQCPCLWGPHCISVCPHPSPAASQMSETSVFSLLEKNPAEGLFFSSPVQMWLGRDWTSGLGLRGQPGSKVRARLPTPSVPSQLRALLSEQASFSLGHSGNSLKKQSTGAFTQVLTERSPVSAERDSF